MDPGNSIKYRFVPGRRRAPRQQGQRQLSGREIAATMIRRQYHQRGNRQRRRHADQELPRGGVQVARPRLPAGRGQPPVAVQAPERPPRPCRPDPPQLEHPVVEVPLHRPQPGDEHLVHNDLDYNGWPRQPDAFEQRPQNGWPQPPLEGMPQYDWPAEYWGQGQPEQLPVNLGQQGDVQFPVQQPNQASACLNQYGQPHEVDQRLCPETRPIRDEGQALGTPPVETNSWPAESGADASPPEEERDPEVPPSGEDQRGLVELDGLIQPPVTTEAPPPREQTEGEGSQFRANGDCIMEPEGREQREPLPSFCDTFRLHSLPSFRDTFRLHDRPAADLLQQEMELPQEVDQQESVASSSAGQSTGILEGDQALTDQNALPAPKPMQEQVNVEPAATNNDEPWEWNDVLEFLTDCGEI